MPESKYVKLIAPLFNLFLIISKILSSISFKIDDKLDPPMFKITETHSAATWLLDPRAPKVEMPPELKARIERMKKDAEANGSKL